jgi:hypothetical protein
MRLLRFDDSHALASLFRLRSIFILVLFGAVARDAVIFAPKEFSLNRHLMEDLLVCTSIRAEWLSLNSFLLYPPTGAFRLTLHDSLDFCSRLKETEIAIPVCIVIIR